MRHFHTRAAGLRRLSVVRNCRFLLSLLAMTLLCMNTFAEGTVKVYYTNPNGWPKPYVYAWPDGTYTDAWPGNAMNWNNEKGMWEYEGPESSMTGILFHDGTGRQTVDLRFFANGIYGNTAFGTPLYVRGNFNDWGTGAEMKTDNGVNYIIEKYDFAMSGSDWPNFKIADSQWGWEYCCNGDSKITPNVERTMDNKGIRDAYIMDGDAGFITAKFNTQTCKLLLLPHKDGAGKPQVEFDTNRSATFSSIYGTDLTQLSEDVKVYYASGISAGEVTLEEVSKDIIVAPNTGLYLYYTGTLTDGKATAEITETEDLSSAQPLTGNKLMAWAPGETCASLDHLCLHNYAFGKLNGGEVGFIHMKADKQNDKSVGKAYLQCPPTNGGTAAASLKVRFSGTTPVICIPKVEGRTGDSTTYNLNGPAASNDRKSLVIRNGRGIMNR